MAAPIKSVLISSNLDNVLILHLTSIKFAQNERYCFYSQIHSSPTLFFYLTLSTRQTKTDICASSVDPDKTAHNEPSHQDIHYLPLLFFDLKTPMCIGGHVQIQCWKSSFQKLRDERVNTLDKENRHYVFQTILLAR